MVLPITMSPTPYCFAAENQAELESFEMKLLIRDVLAVFVQKVVP